MAIAPATDVLICRDCHDEITPNKVRWLTPRCPMCATCFREIWADWREDYALAPNTPDPKTLQEYIDSKQKTRRKRGEHGRKTRLADFEKAVVNMSVRRSGRQTFGIV